MNSSVVRFVSMIDSKPVQPPYLSLVPFKNFTKGDSITGRMMGGKDDHDALGRPQNKNSQIKWSKLLHEDLEELLKQKIIVHMETLKKAKTEGKDSIPN